MSDAVEQIILEELRDHRKESAERHELMEKRVRSLEESRAENRGAIKTSMAISTAFASVISWLVTMWSK